MWGQSQEFVQNILSYDLSHKKQKQIFIKIAILPYKEWKYEYNKIILS